MTNKTNFESTEATRAAGEVVVTGMPSGANYTNGTEYFHPDCGLVSGTWAGNGGASIANKILRFYRAVYKDNSLTPSNNKYLHSLYAGRYASGVYAGQYHPGVDIFKGAGSNIYSAHDGIIKYINTRLGAVGILTSNKVVFYLHMNLKQDLKNLVTSSTGVNDTCSINISKGDFLGTESNVGISSAGAHLHVEVQNPVYVDTFDYNISNVPRAPIPNLSTSFSSKKLVVPYDTLVVDL